MTQYDPDLSGSLVAIVEITGSTDLKQLNTENLVAIQFLSSAFGSDFTNNAKLVRRLSRVASGSKTQDPSNTAADGEGGYKATLVFTRSPVLLQCMVKMV